MKKKVPKAEVQTDPHVLKVWSENLLFFARRAERESTEATRQCNKDDFMKDATYNRTLALGLEKLAAPRWTGLKDRNNKKVYEGDTVEIKLHYGGGQGEVVLGKVVQELATTNLAVLVSDGMGDETYYPLCYAGGKWAEVIGGIFNHE